jgi:molybdopterin converting factor subunit 1
VLVTIHLFARLREIVGAAELVEDVPAGATAREVWDRLAHRYPALSGYDAAISCAVNDEYTRLATPLAAGDRVAFLPPVSGG